MTSRLRLALAYRDPPHGRRTAGRRHARARRGLVPEHEPRRQREQLHGRGVAGLAAGRTSARTSRGYTTQTSFAKGASVPLKIARNAPILPQTRVDITRLSHGLLRRRGRAPDPGAGATNVAGQQQLHLQHAERHDGRAQLRELGRHLHDSRVHACPPRASTWPSCARRTRTWRTGWCSWSATTTACPSRARCWSCRPRPISPTTRGAASRCTATRTAGRPTVSGTGRAVKVSFDRPLDQNDMDRDRYFGPDFFTVQWLERQGYDVSYTDDVQAHLNPNELLEHKVLVIPGHSEYWSREQFLNVKAARDAGVNIASFSANTAYWKVRYENSTRTMVCYKTVQGDGSDGSGRITPNDPGPDGAVGTADDALGLDGQAGTADDRPQNSTTTFRDNGAPPRRPQRAAPGPRRAGHAREPALRRHVRRRQRQQQLPADRPGGQHRRRIRRRHHVAADRPPDQRPDLDRRGHRRLGVGRRPDAGPVCLATACRGEAAERLAHDGGGPELAPGRGPGTRERPAVGQPGTVNAVRYTAPSGARVFAGGTNQWGWGLGYENTPQIQQATYNLLADMSVQPLTPDGISVDPAGGNTAPTAAFSVSPTPVRPNQAATFNASALLGSGRHDHQVRVGLRRQRHLRGQRGRVQDDHPHLHLRGEPQRSACE